MKCPKCESKKNLVKSIAWRGLVLAVIGYCMGCGYKTE